MYVGTSRARNSGLLCQTYLTLVGRLKEYPKLRISCFGDVEDDLMSNHRNQKLHVFLKERAKKLLGQFTTKNGTGFMLEACCRQNEDRTC